MNKKTFRSIAVVLSVGAVAGAVIFIWGMVEGPSSASQALASCPPGQFCGGTISPASVAPGGNYTVTCDYGYVGNGVYAEPGSGTCKYKKFDGTAAVFDCTAGNQPGTFSNSCQLSQLAEPYPSKTNALDSLTVTGSSSGSGGGGSGGGGTGSGTGMSGLPVTALGIQTLNSWKWEHDTGTPGDSNGTTALTANPSLDGSARQFSFSFDNNGGERYSIDIGSDPNATHFIYDTWISLDTPATTQNVELDVNQVLSDGRTVIYATQCAAASGTWEYTENRNGSSHWLRSNIPCNPHSWGAGTWHHVQIASHRDANGVVTYDWVNFDGTQSNFIGATVNSAFSLGWKKGVIVINTQFDGIGKTGTVTAYTDMQNIWRW